MPFPTVPVMARVPRAGDAADEEAHPRHRGVGAHERARGCRPPGICIACEPVVSAAGRRHSRIRAARPGPDLLRRPRTPSPGTGVQVLVAPCREEGAAVGDGALLRRGERERARRRSWLGPFAADATGVPRARAAPIAALRSSPGRERLKRIPSHRGAGPVQRPAHRGGNTRHRYRSIEGLLAEITLRRGDCDLSSTPGTLRTVPSNLEIIFIDWLDALRRGDFDRIASRLALRHRPRRHPARVLLQQPRGRALTNAQAGRAPTPR